VKFKTPIGV